MSEKKMFGKGFVALMRGINVGGKNKLPMKDVVALFEEVGCRHVRTYIQSGNVVFEGSTGLARRATSAVSERIASRFGYSVPIIVRTAKELQDAAARNPFVGVAADPKQLHVGFLAELPSPEAVASLDSARSSVDAFAVSGKEVFLYVPGGMARTKLTTAFFDRGLDTVMTVRNWRTINKLLEMTREL